MAIKKEYIGKVRNQRGNILQILQAYYCIRYNIAFMARNTVKNEKTKKGDIYTPT
jgi:hypothetical protein